MSTTISQRERRAAHGLHRCGFCRQPIDRGEVYDDSRIADMGTVWTWRAHLRCYAFLSEVTEPYDWDDGIDAVSFAEYVRDFPEQAAKHGVIA